MSRFDPCKFPSGPFLSDTNQDQASIPEIRHSHYCLEEPPAKHQPRLRLLEIEPRLFLAPAQCKGDPTFEVGVAGHLCCWQCHKRHPQSVHTFTNCPVSISFSKCRSISSGRLPP